MRKLIAICSFCLFICCTNKSISDLDFLVGTWKGEKQGQLEAWWKNESGQLIGHAYTITDGQKSITETLSIKNINNKIIYSATVLNQNDGKSIQFVLKDENVEYFSFENDEHDFPKKIRYKKINKNKIKVDVLGDNNKGFSYLLLKVNPNALEY